jgi:hypothetical protein
MKLRPDQSDGCQRAFPCSTSLIVKTSRVQILFIALAFFLSATSIWADLTVGRDYQISATDVDGNTFSTADGHLTTVVLCSKANIDKARLVGDRSPDFCLGNPAYRMITVISFETKHSAPTRAVLKSVIRHRLGSESRRLQTRYDQLKIARDARRDVFAVADFDGTITKQLGVEPAADLFRVFVFGKNGELIKEWSDVASAEDLAAALK